MVGTTPFRGSETTGAAVYVYTHGDEADVSGTQSRALQLRFDSRQPGVAEDDDYRLIACSTRKRIDGSAGKFSFTVAANTSEYPRDLRREILDDDWVDIVFTRHDKTFHVMRGLVDSVAVASAFSAATTQAFTVTGRDFTKIFAMTPIWFDRISDSDDVSSAMTRILEQTQALAGSVLRTVQSMLFGFLKELEVKNRATWMLPPQMPPLSGPPTPATRTGAPFGRPNAARPGATQVVTPSVNTFAGDSFADVVNFFTDHWTNDPPRSNAINPMFFDPQNTTLWPLAQHYSDPPLCELYCDLMRRGSTGPRYFDDGESAGVEDTVMAVVLRDRPFPTYTRQEGISQGPWFEQIAQYQVDRRDCTNIATVRSGAERLNMFMAAPQVFQESLGAWPELQTPLINRADVARHGIRRLDVMTEYIATPDDIGRGSNSPLALAHNYRQRTRDFHCMNHLWFSGRVELAIGRPDIHVGGRLLIVGRAPEFDETYYVEEVGHDWHAARDLNSAAQLRTSFGVTRGWIGTDHFLLQVMTRTRNEYNDRDVQRDLERQTTEVDARRAALVSPAGGSSFGESSGGSSFGESSGGSSFGESSGGGSPF